MNQPRVLNQSTFNQKVRKLLKQHLPRPAAPSVSIAEREIPFDVPFAEATRRWQRQRLLDALEQNRADDDGWNISAASRALGLPRSQVYRLLRRLKVPHP